MCSFDTVLLSSQLVSTNGFIAPVLYMLQFLILYHIDGPASRSVLVWTANVDLRASHILFGSFRWICHDSILPQSEIHISLPSKNLD